MIRIFLLFSLLVLTPSIAKAVSEDDFSEEKICKLSAACKKVCDLKLMDSFEGLPQDKKNLVVQCSQDIVDKFNLKPAQTTAK